MYEQQVEQYIQEIRKMAEESESPEEAAQIIRELTPEPLFRDMPGSPDAFSVVLKRPGGARPFCMRVLPGRREHLPLMIISPGYGGTLRDIPAETSKRYTSVFLSPLGYGTVDGGQANELQEHGIWPVLANTVFGAPGGYTDWLLDAMYAIAWATKHTNADASRMVFSGCSQGGAMSIILGAIYKEICMAICADQPFLVKCSGERIHDFINTVVHSPYQVVTLSEAERNLALIDPMNYVPLLHNPVLICSGSEDRQCPDRYNKALFKALPEGSYNRYVLHKGRVHGYSSWFFETMMLFLRGAL